MKRVLAMVGWTCIVVSAASGQPQKPTQVGKAEDETAIRAIVNHWQQAWSKFDASIMEGDYATTLNGRTHSASETKEARKLAFIAVVFKRPAVQGRRTTWNEARVRFVRSDVALAYRDYQTLGHKTPDGKEMPQRNTPSTWLLTKDGGKWRIASQVISDDVVMGQ
jgi:uncharacterized protein (TIGR02246 family)